jgi:hypothetical protein
MGQPHAAVATLDQASALAGRHGEPHAAAMAAIGKAHALIALGQADAAEVLLVAAELEIRELGAQWLLAVTLNTRGRVAFTDGDPARAEELLRESAGILGRLQDTWAIRYTLTHLADAAALRSDNDRAALLCGAADPLVESNVMHFPVLSQLSGRCRTAATERLSTELFDAAYREGRALPMAEAIAFAVGDRR